MHPTTRLDQRQHQTLSPRLQHAVRLLQMSSIEFAQQLHEQVARNPFLEDDSSALDDPVAHPQAVPPVAAGADPVSADITDALPGLRERCAELVADDEPQREPWFADGAIGAPRQDGGGSTSALDLMPVPSSLRTHLHGQLDVLPLPMRDRLLAEAVVESLDEDGYLRMPLGDILAETDLDPPPAADELRIALCRVQALEPAGVAARDVGECLALQLPTIACAEQRALAATIVKDHLHRLADGDVDRVSAVLGRSAADVGAAFDCIRRLDPRPGWRFDSRQAEYITPDVLVRRWRGDWQVVLNPAVVPRVRVNQHYAQLFQRHRSAHDDELAAHLQDARWTLRNVEQRFATILAVAQAIARRQRRFFELGALAMKPLALRDIADEVGVHESTVSRVTRNKYIATPLGVYELKYFFSRALTARSGAEFSPTAIRGVIKEIIDAEPASAPLSDGQIAALLERQGLVVARRTVTKYRQLLHIAAAERRRRAVSAP